MSWSRALSWLVALVIGAAYGTAGTIAHSYRLGGFPLGLVLAIIGVAALLIAIRALTDDRWGALFCGIGLIAATVVFSGMGPGGSVIVPSGKLDSIGVVNLGVVWTIAVPVLTLAVVLWPAGRRVGVTASN
jgi:hypothetical protein